MRTSSFVGLLLAAAFLTLGRSSAQPAESANIPEPRSSAPFVDERRIAELANVGRAASAEAQRTLDARVLPFELTWGLL